MRPPVVSGPKPLMGCRALRERVAGEHLTIRSRLAPSTLPDMVGAGSAEGLVALFVGDDWVKDHHDVEVPDETRRRLGRARLSEGAVGMSRLHELIAAHLDDDARDPATG
ncbi:hypothetical protein [Actinomycetospora aurantiaca]|uniref:hypothetical protein n=1 Tax=Actinomycetospora aurantiaca TaxID=3129233 RepID=UPI0035A0C8ED